MLEGREKRIFLGNSTAKRRGCEVKLKNQCWFGKKEGTLGADLWNFTLPSHSVWKELQKEIHREESQNSASTTEQTWIETLWLVLCPFNEA